MFLFCNFTNKLCFVLCRVTGDQVSFRIMPNDRNLDPFVVVEKADDLRGSIRQLSGLEVVSVGIGDEVRILSPFSWRS